MKWNKFKSMYHSANFIRHAPSYEFQLLDAHPDLDGESIVFELLIHDKRKQVNISDYSKSREEINAFIMNRSTVMIAYQQGLHDAVSKRKSPLHRRYDR